MLIWSPKGRAAAGVVASALFIVFFFLPLAVILMSSLSQQWNGILPSAIPSVSVGLGILVAFSQGPLQMNGTLWIVLTAHFVLISAFTFSNVSTGLARISADIENVASSLGASPWYRLRHVTLPLLMPWMMSALALSLSLSMGELGATMMIYPPGWTTLPVAIFSLTDRGNIADGAALTIVLVAITLLLMMKLERIAKRLGQK
ncbi:ABC transporter permease subunit [Salmonella enterica]|nr:ABC transporter permease subunit [Salmonella enterica]